MKKALATVLTIVTLLSICVVPAMLVNDRTLVPVRAISEALNCNVDWDDATQTVIIEN